MQLCNESSGGHDLEWCASPHLAKLTHTQRHQALGYLLLVFRHWDLHFGLQAPCFEGVPNSTQSAHADGHSGQGSLGLP